MKIAVTSLGPDLKSSVDPRFGRCAYFIFVDPETMEFEAIENPNLGAFGGAGIQSAQLVVNKGAKVVLTGSCGPNAFQTLQAAGVEVIVGVSGTVQEAIEQYKAGKLRATFQPNVPLHFGTGYGPGWGMGRGMGKGMGRGRGMGMGFGPMPSGMEAPFSFSPSTSEQELEFLKQQAEFLRQQIEGIYRRIKELEGLKGEKRGKIKVAISTDEESVSAHFGRCQAYTIYEIEEGKILSKEVIPNPGHQPGFLPQFLAEKGVNCIITGGMGPKAQSLFAERGIQTIIGVSGKVEEVIQKFINNALEIGENLCTHEDEGGQCH